MTSSSRLVLALLVLASVALSSPAEAQRRGDAPGVTLLLGGTDALYAALVAAANGPLTPRTDLSRIRALTFTDVRAPGARGGDCDVEAPECNGGLRVRTDPSNPSSALTCYTLYNVSVFPSMSEVTSGLQTQTATVEFERIERAACPTGEE